MKYARTLGLSVIAAAVLLIVAVPASADTLTGPSGEGTPTFHFVSEDHITLQTFVTVRCPSTAEGAITAHPEGAGSSGRVQGNFTNLTFGHNGNPCTDGWHVTVVAPGTLSMEWISNGEGTVRSTGMTLTLTRFGVTCKYVTNDTDIGVFTDRTKAANGLGTLDIHGDIPLHTGSSGLCGTGTTTMDGFYRSTIALLLHNT